jgi:hypothetical protein
VFPLNLYARVRFCLLLLHTGPRVQRAPGLPRALFFWGEMNLQNSGGCCREKAESQPVVVPALSRDPYAVCSRFCTGADAFYYN